MNFKNKFSIHAKKILGKTSVSLLILLCISTLVIVIWKHLINNDFTNNEHALDLVPEESVISTSNQPEQPQDYLGHLPYEEAQQNRLMTIASYAQEQYQRFELLDIEAGPALMKLIYAARDEGVWIVPVSGFRTIEHQRLLFEAQVQRTGSVEAAAKVSAPPGYTEHHSGYAIDLTDGRFPKQDLTDEFANTDAYRWLTEHAQEFGFELSFPPNNPQGVIFEPWHWRFVGSQRAAAIFVQANSLQR